MLLNVPVLLYLCSVWTGAQAEDACAKKLLKLPWGTYQAQTYSQLSKDVLGPQFDIPKAPLDLSPLAALIPGDLAEGEDCLFLDIYVPLDAPESPAPGLPVVVWIYGGAYAFGSKRQLDPLYGGQSIIEAASRQLIFVAGNYRVGAFGWLAGSNFEKSGGLPNAGLHDQHLLLEFVQAHIGQVGGDPAKVSAWGESAGAGSILHHLIRENGRKDPLFSRAILQSPAYQWKWDRTGAMNDVSSRFSELAGCGSPLNMSCLRSAPIDNLVKANTKIWDQVFSLAQFPVGPSIDGQWVTKLPAASFAQGDYWKGLDSILVSHVEDESSVFTPKSLDEKTTFDNFVNAFVPQSSLKPVQDAIRNQYNCVAPPYYGNYFACMKALIGDACFTCNTRQLHDAYAATTAKPYMLSFGLPAPVGPAAVHGADILMTFIHSQVNLTALLDVLQTPNIPAVVATLAPLLPKYQAYLASHAVSGTPNGLRSWDMPSWSPAGVRDGRLTDVLRVKLGLGVSFFDNAYEDPLNAESICGFWMQVAANITRLTPATASEGPQELTPALEL